jgi:hypothetical protein
MTAPTTEATAAPILSPTVTSLSVSPDGYAFVVDENGAILQSTDQSQPWTAQPGNIAVSAVAASAGELVFGIGPDGNACVASTDEPADSWEELPAAGVKLAALAPGEIDTSTFVLWAIDSSSQVWSYQSGPMTWAAAKVTATQVAATSDGAVYRLDGGSLYAFDADASSWSQMKTPETVVSIAAGALENLWIVGTSGTVYEYDPGDGNGWYSVAPPAKASGGVLSAADDGTLWLLLSDTLYQYNPDTDGWDTVSWTPQTTLAQASIANLRNAWALDSKGSIYQYTEFIDAWIPISVVGPLPPLAIVSAESGEGLWGIDGAQGVWYLEPTTGGWEPIGQFSRLAGISAVADGPDDAAVWGFRDNGTYDLVADNGDYPVALKPTLSAIAVGNWDLIVGLDTAGSLYQWDEHGRWVEQAGGPFIDIAIDANGLMHAIGTDHVLYMFQGAWFKTGATGLTQISAAGNGELWGVTVDGYPVQVGTTPNGEGARQQIASRTGGGGLTWDTENPFDEAQSTHLWIVNRGAQLAAQQGGIGKQIYSLLKPFQGKLGDPFHDSLCQGLYDADFKAAYNNPILGTPTYQSHFYDPDTGYNWMHNTSPTAVTNSTEFFQAALTAYQQTPQDLATAGYNLGLSLHYLTDLTQPMHAANFTYLNSGPTLGYHTDFERYVMQIQNDAWKPSTYVASALGTAPDAYLKAAAKNSKSKYYDTICPYSAFYGYWSLTPGWKRLVRDNAPAILADAITITSQYLVAWMTAAVSPTR